ncbi:Gfo/Idh/MocA family oxidoreductase [Aliiroseovarius sp. KMU-50]|uniref:Gfo/Idh/MocA family oxidoreductase n=1 Tax=Aliiroseovarius salicola TaxID=3009082 RepID=A0ABT4W5M5_9RHOB|nr:Gfo/Idh/MocA family oxidoreductase [Aliiroseovarius sp. KMU-50]MDA5095828.1 Gfo/Idh/MocA family oxidoreductase [Aliiroseovarius sp. KMU-50]
MKQTIQIAIAGAGLVGKRHVAAIDQLKDVELCAVVDPGEDAQHFASERGLPCYGSLTELFANHTPDGVVLATPTPLHVNQALECVEQGCPVLVEKPLGTSAKEAAKLVEAAEKRNVPLLVGHHRRHNPLIRKAHEVVSGGEIGDVRAVHVNCWFYKPDDYFDTAPWRKKLGAGPISVNLVHDVDLIRYLCGEVVSVQGQATPSARGFENEDVAAALLRFENGAIGTITVSDSVVSPWSWELTSREYPIYPPTPESCYMIGGSRGSLSVPDLRLWSHHGGVQDWWTPISATSLTRGSSDPLVNQMTHFARVVRGEEAPIVSGFEGLQTLQVIEAIQQACSSGESVAIPKAKNNEFSEEKQGVA